MATLLSALSSPALQLPPKPAPWRPNVTLNPRAKRRGAKSISCTISEAGTASAGAGSKMEDYNTAMKRMMRNPYEYHHDLGGTGVPPGTKPETCRACKGAGMIFMQSGPFRMQTPCTSCGGTRKSYKSLCQSCKGQKIVRGTKVVKVDVIPETGRSRWSPTNA